MQNFGTYSEQDVGPLITGVFDVLFAFAVAIERKGLLERREIAATLRTVKEQVEAQQGGPTKRSTLAEWLLPAFEAPAAGEQARLRFSVIDGGAASGGETENGLSR